MLGVRQVDHNNEMTVSGPSFEELTLAEMHSIQGMDDIQDETTRVCAIIRAARTSVMGGIILGIATGITIVLTIRKC